MKNNSVRSRRSAKKQQKSQKQFVWIGGSLVVVVALVGILFALTGGGGTSVSFPDIHGISFTGDGEQLRVATHTGLVAYQDGNWSTPDLPVNDYMGYSGTDDGFFSSGHPGVGSQLVNPIGLVRSTDHGESIETINFLGETDFHVMGASYYGETVYVVNPSPNSLLSIGFHYSLDGGETWEQSAAEGLTAAPIQITVHPSEAGTVAVATQSGVFFSNNFGTTFTPISDGIVTSVVFDPNGERLLFGFDTLFSYRLSDAQTLPLPEMPTVDSDQAILYIAVNPANDAVAFATSDRDVFYSPNGGQSWEKIGENGASS